MAVQKAVKKTIPAPRPHWVGDGFNVYPVFDRLAFTNELSPWLMFDYAAPKHFPATKKQLGVGQHPHRGMETVTIAWQGEVEHGDSMGNRDVIKAGDVQWMTAGRGIVHEEFHSREFAARGGTLEMCQLWVNLPRASKMVPPRYQPILAASIPEVELSGGAGSARVIAGALGAATGPAKTYSPLELFDVKLAEEKEAEIPIPEGHTAIVFVRAGAVRVAGTSAASVVEAQGVALLGHEGSAVQLVALKPETQVLIMAGEPIDEPIAARGPFVMNTQEELMQAQMDFMSGRMGT